METIKDHYKNLIIGFGKGGKTLAGWLAARNEEVALIEKSRKMYGGTCINVACIPTKSLIINAEKGVPYGKAHAVKDALTEKLRKKNYDKINTSNLAVVIDGTASFLSPNRVKVLMEEGEKTITADRIFINTGTQPFIPEIEGIHGKNIYDSTGLMELDEKPRSLAIIGGGFVGLEFADMFLKFGSEVTLFDPSDTFLPREDPDVAASIYKVLTEKGLKAVLGVEVGRLSQSGSGVEVQYNNGNDKLITSTVLVATGRAPVTSMLNLEAAGIETDERGFIKVNDQLQTTANNVWAIGDVNGGPQFTYISLDDFRIIKNQLSEGGYNYTNMRKPFATTVFVTPPYARVGINEKEAREQGINYSVRTLSADNIPKAAILQQKEGLLKAIVAEDTGKILGCMLHCAEAHELINIVQIAMNNGIDYKHLRDNIYTHPSMAESFNDLFS